MYRHSGSAMKTIIILSLSATIVFASRLPFRLSKRDSGRIVGGEDAAPKQFPYIVSLQSENAHQCGGSLLNENYAITAAHCCYSYNVADYVIVAGTNKWNEGGETYGIEEFIVHPNYVFNDTGMYNDICLLRLASRVKETDSIKFIDLNRNIYDRPQPAEVAGWGYLKLGGETPDNLQWMRQTILTHEDCIERVVKPLTTKQICAINKCGKSTCQADSGGPLVVRDKNGKPLLTGLVSFGDSCQGVQPDVYTQVASYIDWIDGYINN